MERPDGRACSSLGRSWHRAILGELHEDGAVQWALTADKIGFLAIYGWSDAGIPAVCNAALDQMRDTRGLVVNVRLNGGGSEDLAQEVAGRFVANTFVYGYSQVRSGPGHSDLTDKRPRSVAPRGPWRYGRPVILLIGQKCMSSNESFVAMMSGVQPQVRFGPKPGAFTSGHDDLLATALERLRAPGP